MAKKIEIDQKLLKGLSGIDPTVLKAEIVTVANKLNEIIDAIKLLEFCVKALEVRVNVLEGKCRL